MDVLNMGHTLHLVHVVRRSVGVDARDQWHWFVHWGNGGAGRGLRTRLDPLGVCPAPCFRSTCIRPVFVLSFHIHVSRWVLVGNLYAQYLEDSTTVCGQSSYTFTAWQGDASKVLVNQTKCCMCILFVCVYVTRECTYMYIYIYIYMCVYVCKRGILSTYR